MNYAVMRKFLSISAITELCQVLISLRDITGCISVVALPLADVRFFGEISLNAAQGIVNGVIKMKSYLSVLGGDWWGASQRTG